MHHFLLLDESRGKREGADETSIRACVVCFVQKLPEARSGHTLVAIGDKLYMCGGWNAMRQFDDLWAFDTHNRLWNKIEGASGDKWGTSFRKLEHQAKGA